MNTRRALRILDRIGPYGWLSDQEERRLYHWARTAPQGDIGRVMARTYAGKAYAYAVNCLATRQKWLALKGTNVTDMTNEPTPATDTPTTRVYFISGHLDLTDEEFAAHYEPALHAAAREPGVTFVVGDAGGADVKAQVWLRSYGVEWDQVTVYHMFVAARNNAGPFLSEGGYTSDKTRDEAMTAASTHDIAWVRPGREKSGTAKNLKRRKPAGA